MSGGSCGYEGGYVSEADEGMRDHNDCMREIEKEREGLEGLLLRIRRARGRKR